MTKPLDENDRWRAGTLNLDPFADCEPMPTPGTPKPVDLDTIAPTFAAAYGLAELEADRTRQLVSLAQLPSWPGGPAEGHGWGGALDTILGGGVCPGYLLAVGASRAGAGKTAWTMQIAEGLALRCAQVTTGEADGPLTPVVILSEMGIRALTWRSLARWTGVDSRTFRAGKSAPEADAGNYPWEQAKQAFESLWGKSRHYLRIFRADSSGRDLVDDLARAVDAWRAQLEATKPGTDVWPVVVMDPIQRWQDTSKSEVEALNELVEAVGAHAERNRWIGFLTSDTNKASATATSTRDRDDDDSGAGVFRGSYKLLHLVDAALYLRTPKDGTGPPRGDNMEAVLVKNRWGTVRPKDGAPRYTWHPTTGRFEVNDDTSGEGWTTAADLATPKRAGGRRRAR